MEERDKVRIPGWLWPAWVESRSDYSMRILEEKEFVKGKSRSSVRGMSGRLSRQTSPYFWV